MDVGPEIPASDLAVGDLLHRLDKDEWWLVLASEPSTSSYPGCRTITKLNLDTLTKEGPEDLVSLVAKYWDHHKC
jgi:hypothetical protein